MFGFCFHVHGPFSLLAHGQRIISCFIMNHEPPKFEEHGMVDVLSLEVCLHIWCLKLQAPLQKKALLRVIPTLKGDLEEGRAHVVIEPDKGGHAD